MERAALRPLARPTSRLLKPQLLRTSSVVFPYHVAFSHPQPLAARPSQRQLSVSGPRYRLSAMPHKEEYSEFTPEQYPPFPDDPQFPTVELKTISLNKLEQNDEEEKARAFEAFKTRGFVYLELVNFNSFSKPLQFPADTLLLSGWDQERRYNPVWLRRSRERS